MTSNWWKVHGSLGLWGTPKYPYTLLVALLEAVVEISREYTVQYGRTLQLCARVCDISGDLIRDSSRNQRGVDPSDFSRVHCERILPTISQQSCAGEATESSHSTGEITVGEDPEFLFLSLDRESRRNHQRCMECARVAF